MRTVVHLSDLHFGRIDPATLGPLEAAVKRLEPHAVVVSGDLTQRAKAKQFREARAFLDRLPQPQVVVPGNHDVPLYRVWERFLAPYGKFVYVSNRGHNTIAVFKVGDDRKLTPAGHITGDIKTPRNFNISPDGKWMLIASQDGGKVGVYAIDEKDGTELFKFKTPSGIIGNVMTYSHNGKQHVAVLSGVGGWAGIGLAAGLTAPTEGLGAVGGYAYGGGYK